MQNMNEIVSKLFKAKEDCDADFTAAQVWVDKGDIHHLVLMSEESYASFIETKTIDPRSGVING